METAKLFENGKSQAVRLPKKCRFFPKQQSWEIFLNGLNSFTDDIFSDGREQEIVTRRESL